MFTNNTTVKGGGSLTVNNAEIKANINQTNLTVNGQAAQKADINLTNQLTVTQNGKITNDNNKITANSLDNKGNIVASNGTGNGTMEINSGTNTGNSLTKCWKKLQIC